ncbi:MAG: hypothetical protein IH850_09850 [Acidobacteria bacterium]|nr:hypothetical protein [Acidobacteriota bacterium]
MLSLIVLLIAGIGIIVLPDLIDARQPVPRLVARGIRLPTLLSIVAAIGFGVFAGPILRTLTNAPLGLGLAPAFLAVTLVLAPWMGVTKSALIALGASSWILPSQFATASATLIAAAVSNQGLVWAAAAIATAHVVASGIRWYGMRSKAALPSLRHTLSPSGIRSDLRAIARLATPGGRE